MPPCLLLVNVATIILSTTGHWTFARRDGRYFRRFVGASVVSVCYVLLWVNSALSAEATQIASCIILRAELRMVI